LGLNAFFELPVDVGVLGHFFDQFMGDFLIFGNEKLASHFTQIFRISTSKVCL